MKTVLPREQAVEDIFSRILASPEASGRLRGADQTYFFHTIPEEVHLHPHSGKRERAPAKSGPDSHPPAYVHHPDIGKTLTTVCDMADIKI